MRDTAPDMKVRLPRPLRRQIEEAAKAHRRSLNAEVIDRLERSFQEGKTRQRPPLSFLKAGHQQVGPGGSLADRLRAIEERLEKLEGDRR